MNGKTTDGSTNSYHTVVDMKIFGLCLSDKNSFNIYNKLVDAFTSLSIIVFISLTTPIN